MNTTERVKSEEIQKYPKRVKILNWENQKRTYVPRELKRKINPFELKVFYLDGNWKCQKETKFFKWSRPKKLNSVRLLQRKYRPRPVQRFFWVRRFRSGFGLIQFTPTLTLLTQPKRHHFVNPKIKRLLVEEIFGRILKVLLQYLFRRNVCFQSAYWSRMFFNRFMNFLKISFASKMFYFRFTPEQKNQSDFAENFSVEMQTIISIEITGHPVLFSIIGYQRS